MNSLPRSQTEKRGGEATELLRVKHDTVAPRFSLPRFLALWGSLQCADNDLPRDDCGASPPSAPRALTPMYQAVFCGDGRMHVEACHATWPKGGENLGSPGLELELLG